MHRFGLYGGSFDPPHLAHLALARLARAQLGLDLLLLVPTGRQWQKAGALAPAADRLAMLQAAFAGEPGCEVDACELEREGPSYTADTVDALLARPRFAGAECCVVIGQDQFANLPTWHRWQDLAGHVTFAVAARAGQPVVPPPALAGRAHRAVALALPEMAVSSTQVRERAARGEGIDTLVSAAVARYIESHALYRAPGAAA